MKRLMLSVTLLLAGSALVLILHYLAEGGTTNSSFNRIFPPHYLGGPISTKVGSSSYYLAGMAAEGVFLGDYGNPLTVFQFDYRGNYIRTYSFQLPAGASITKSTKVEVRYPLVYLTDGLWATVYYGKLTDELLFARSLPFPFSRVLVISDSSYVLLAYDDSVRQNQLYKVDFMSDQHIETMYPLVKQVDGFICTQGTLTYDEVEQRIHFVYQFRNEMIGLGSDLQPIFYNHTIDTISVAQLKIDTLETDGVLKVTHGKPPLLVNRSTSFSGNQLFVQSAIRADNEVKSEFESSAVVDVYVSMNGKYLWSFYLPKHEGTLPNDFRVLGDKVATITGHHLHIYDLLHKD